MTLSSTTFNDMTMLPLSKSQAFTSTATTWASGVESTLQAGDSHAGTEICGQVYITRTNYRKRCFMAVR